MACPIPYGGHNNHEQICHRIHKSAVTAQLTITNAHTHSFHFTAVFLELFHARASHQTENLYQRVGFFTI